MLHDPETEQSVVIVFFETEDDYKRGDEILGAMPTGDTPGRRVSVTKYNVATRMTPNLIRKAWKQGLSSYCRQ